MGEFSKSKVKEARAPTYIFSNDLARKSEHSSTKNQPNISLRV
jgi:hypothetical protein